MVEQTRALLCGGIGSGKSTAAGILTGLGALVISADSIGHQVLEPNSEVFGFVCSRWPEVVRNGRIDRRALGRIVFSDRSALRELEALTHWAIRARITQILLGADDPVILVELPLIWDFFGKGWVRVVVDAPDHLRVQRLLHKGMSPEEVAQRMAVQPSRQEWLDAADAIIDNSGDLSSLESECRRVLAWLESGAGAGRAPLG